MKIEVDRELLKDIIREGMLFDFHDTEEYNKGIEKARQNDYDFIMFRHEEDDREKIKEIKRAVMVNKLDCFVVVPFSLSFFKTPEDYIDFNDIDKDIQFIFKSKLSKYL